MGRKIPGRKHRGVRDPEKQRQQRLDKVKKKINAPPSNPDNQDVPKSLERLIELKQKAAAPIKTGKTRKTNKRAPFKQNPGETDHHFLYRVNKACENVIKETAFEIKYNVNIKKDPKTGNVTVRKSRRDDLVEHMKKVKKEQKVKGKKKKKKPEDEAPKLSKWQKRKMKLKSKAEEKMFGKGDAFKQYEDRVGFGEVVHAPPSLTLPRRAQSDGVPRPGQKDLLLKSALSTKEDSAQKIVEKKDKLKGTAKKVIDRKGKRKDLPHALRRQLETQQREVIQAYKNLKKEKLANK